MATDLQYIHDRRCRFWQRVESIGWAFAAICTGLSMAFIFGVFFGVIR